jgi:hypothetical protein
MASQMAANDVVGLYVDTDKTVYVKGDQLTPFVKVTLAHELTHALQDQYFNLGKIKGGSADDEEAVTALIEGDAVRVQNAYARSLPADQQQSYLQEEQQGSSQASTGNTSAGVPGFLTDQAQFPYDLGPTFVAALLQQGGNTKVDEAFRHPPTLDASIVNPQSFQAGTPAPSVKAPPLPSGAKAIMPPSGFGQVTLLEMLGDQIGFDAAWGAVQGWAVDSFVPYTEQGHVCVNLAVLDGSASGAATLQSAGELWAAHVPGATVASSGRIVDFHSCDPGPAWRPVRQSDPYQALATRALVIADLVTNAHFDASRAACTTDHLLNAVGADRLGRAEASTPADPAFQSVASATRQAVFACLQVGS